MNGAAAFFPAPPNNSQYGYKTCKITQVWNPLCYLLWEPDQNLNPGCYGDASSYPDSSEGLGRLHVKGGNVLALGGNTLFMSIATFQNEQNLTSKNLLWWNPKTPNGH